MTIKDILIHLDSRASCTARLNVGIDLAVRHNAHLTGLYVMPPVMPPTTYGAAYLPAEVIETQEQEAQATTAKVEADFRAATDKAGCEAAWHCVEGAPDRQINRHACYADLVIAGQTDTQGAWSADAAVADYVVLGSPSPVLLIPYIGAREPVGKRVMIAWNDSREAARAVQGALPLLTAADSVDVVAVNPGAGEGDLATADLCLHLARHGVTAEGSQMVAKDIDVGDVLLSRAADRGIDLLVMGAYGHTRLRETMLGGVTRHLLAHMTVPVLMAH